MAKTVCGGCGPNFLKLKEKRKEAAQIKKLALNSKKLAAAKAKKASAKKTVAKKKTIKKTSPAKSPAKKVTKKAAVTKKLVKPDAPIFEVRQMFEKESSKVQLSDEAADVLNNLLMEHFTNIASKAVQIIKKAAKADVSINDVRKIVNKVMKDGAKK